MKLKRIGPLSALATGGTLYGLLGLLFGALFSVLSIVGAGFAGLAGDQDAGGALIGVFFGLGAIILLPVLYGLMGAISGLVLAVIYNIIAKITGGIELDLE